MKIKIKRFQKDLPLPERKTAGAAAFDLTARETVEIQPGTVGYVPLNVALETPPEHFLLLAPRSSTHKKGLIPANGIGILDPDFCGDGDEVKSAYYNFTDAPVRVERGERVAQAMIIKFVPVEWDEVEKMEHKTRGGFGTTGK
ncbi:MAG: dUTP diphosphatase [Patescibacteria group bacterium]|nr:dUTP diphosphatase [Patescibacteria group bacterium]